mmetsp:Transcript_44617/g.123655  ORF Transcript_44617/g.123655 Transcript_44617/m.123655 type:complete len:279 (-) Transcript_44617:105-941(-)
MPLPASPAPMKNGTTPRLASWSMTSCKSRRSRRLISSTLAACPRSAVTSEVSSACFSDPARNASVIFVISQHNFHCVRFASKAWARASSRSARLASRSLRRASSSLNQTAPLPRASHNSSLTRRSSSSVVESLLRKSSWETLSLFISVSIWHFAFSASLAASWRSIPRTARLRSRSWASLSSFSTSSRTGLPAMSLSRSSHRRRQLSISCCSARFSASTTAILSKRRRHSSSAVRASALAAARPKRAPARSPWSACTDFGSARESSPWRSKKESRTCA